MRIHRRGFIEDGLHARGKKYRDTEAAAGNGLFMSYLREGYIEAQRRNKQIRIVLKKEMPMIAFGGKGELGKRRMQHFIRNMADKGWMPEAEFKADHAGLYANLVDAFKS